MSAPQAHPRPRGVLARLEWRLLLACVAAPVLIYPLRLRMDWLRDLSKYIGSHEGPFRNFLRDQVEPLVSFYYSPINLKMIAAAWAVIAFLAVWLARLALGKAGGANRPDCARLAWLRSSPRRMSIGLGWLLFFAWAGLSAFWSPTPLLARDALLVVAVFGLFGWAVMARGITSAEGRGVAALMVGLGLLVMALAYAEAYGDARLNHDANAHPVVFMFFERFADVRNVFGSFLGHNTSAAMFMVLTCFFALAYAVESPRRLVRAGAVVYILAAVGCVFIQQSRSGWVLGAVFGALALRSAFKRAGRRPPPRWIYTLGLTLLALLLLSQIDKSPSNPFYSRRYDLVTRLNDLTPARLLKETRLRINYLGPRIVAEHPVIGHGLFAFQYVFPRVQGEYFRQHTDSVLYETDKRSHMAHNDYLQIAIDHGLVGLALALGALVEIARRGWRLRRRIAPEDRPWHEACGWAGLAFAVHGLVDFPFHIPQVALPGMLSLFAWAAWRVPEEEAAALQATPADDGAGRGRFRPVMVVRLLAAMLLLAGAVPAMLPFGRWLQADEEFYRAQALNDLFESVVASGEPVHPAPQAFASAARHLNLSLSLQPSNALGRQFKAALYYRLGALQRRAWQSAEAAGRAQEAGVLRSEAIQNLNIARLALEKSFEGVDYHALYFIRANIFAELNRLEPNPAFQAERIKSLETGYNYCTNYMPLVYDLYEALSREPDPPLERIRMLRRQIWKYDMDGFLSKFERPAVRLVASGMYERGCAVWAEIAAADPSVTRWQYYLAETLFLARRRAEAKPIFETVVKRGDFQYGAAWSRLYLACISGDMKQMLEALEKTDWSGDPYPIWGQARRRAFHDLLHERLGMKPADPSPFPKTEDRDQAAWEYLLEEDRLWALSHYLEDTPASVAYVKHLLTLKDGKYRSPQLWIDAFNAARHAGDLNLAETCLELAYKTEPRYSSVPDFRRLMKLLREEAKPAAK